MLFPFVVVACSPQIYPQFTSSALLSPAEYAIVCDMLKPGAALADVGRLTRRPRPRQHGERPRTSAILHLARVGRGFWASSRTVELIDGHTVIVINRAHVIQGVLPG